MPVNLLPLPIPLSPALVEPSFAEAIAIIAAAEELSRQIRRHWPTSLRRIAKALDKPLESIPAHYSAVWPMLAQLHPVPTGMKLKTLLNHKANVKRALLWLERADGIPKRGAPLASQWQELQSKLRPWHPPVDIFVIDAVLLGARYRTGRAG